MFEHCLQVVQIPTILYGHGLVRLLFQNGFLSVQLVSLGFVDYLGASLVQELEIGVLQNLYSFANHLSILVLRTKHPRTITTSAFFLCAKPNEADKNIMTSLIFGVDTHDKMCCSEIPNRNQLHS